MQTITRYGKHISCPLCSSKRYTVLYPSTFTAKDFRQEVITESVKNSLDDYTIHGQIVKCRSCSLVYTNPMESIPKLLKGYEDVIDEEYLRSEEFRKILLSQHLKKVEKFKRTGRILDVGCFAGFFLELAKNHGFETDGVEPSKWASKEAKRRGIRIVATTIQRAKIQPQTYDIITLWDVIEHLPDPHKVLNVIAKIVKKDGIVAMGTPNIESLFAKIMGSQCPFLIRMHLVLYSPATLQNLFEQHGFKVIYTANYARTFPVSYILDRLRIKNPLFTLFRSVVKKLPILPDIPITLRLGDSFVMIAQKK